MCGCCLFIFVFSRSTLLMLPQFTTSRTVWVGKRKTQQTFVEWRETPLLSLPERSLAESYQVSNTEPTLKSDSCCRPRCGIQSGLKFAPAKDFMSATR